MDECCINPHTFLFLFAQSFYIFFSFGYLYVSKTILARFIKAYMPIIIAHMPTHVASSHMHVTFALFHNLTELHLRKKLICNTNDELL